MMKYKRPRRQDVQRILSEAYEQYLLLEGEPEVLHRNCLVASLAVLAACQKLKYRACINAGSAEWRANEQECIAFEWQNWDDDLLGACLTQGFLPEMHVWAVLPERKWIIDMTAPTINRVAEEMGIRWTMPLAPPAFVDCSNPPVSVRYAPSERASHFAYAAADWKARNN